MERSIPVKAVECQQGCVGRPDSAHVLQGMEVYSTVLWHLKRESELSHLAQEAVAWDRRSPRAWAIMGNCFSLQKVPSSLVFLQALWLLLSHGMWSLFA